MKSIMKMTLAALLATNVNASGSAADLVSQALTHVESGSEARMHLESALESLTTKSETEILASHSQTVAVPIDEKRALTVRVSPTYVLDEINSVTLKSFRKIVGYDTFESIRRKNRNESKDTSDYYNVTVSMMVRRRPAEASAAPARDPYAPDGAPSLAATLDKGFPYDD
jgi:glycogen debranching enzyme